MGINLLTSQSDFVITFPRTGLSCGGGDTDNNQYFLEYLSLINDIITNVVQLLLLIAGNYSHRTFTHLLTQFITFKTATSSRSSGWEANL